MTAKNPLQVYWDIRDIKDMSITGVQHHLLFFLQSCMNTDGECWYSVDEIAYKTRWSKSSVQRNLKHLIKKHYVIIKRKGGSGAKDTNTYSLNWKSIKGVTEAPLIDDKASIRVSERHPSLWISYPQGCHTDQIRVSHRPNKGVTQTPEDINEDIKEVLPRQKSRAGKNEYFLPNQFQPNDEHVVIAKTNQLDIFERLEQFKSMCKARGRKSFDWNEEFKAYLLGCFKKQKKTLKQNEVRSTVPWFNPKDNVIKEV